MGPGEEEGHVLTRSRTCARLRALTTPTPRAGPSPSPQELGGGLRGPQTCAEAACAVATEQVAKSPTPLRPPLLLGERGHAPTPRGQGPWKDHPEPVYRAPLPLEAQEDRPRPSAKG